MLKNDDANDLLFAFRAKISDPAVAKHADSNYSHMCIKQYFRIGSNVVLRKNLWVEAGLFNGSKGKIVDIFLNDDHSVKCFLVKFEKFKGKGWRGSDLVPVEPIIFEHKSSQKYFRTLIPLDISDALTVYKV